MYDLDITPGARRLVEVNGCVKKGESVVVLTDETMTAIADVVAATARDVGADVLECIMSVRGHDGQEPPDAAAAAMKKADVIFTPVSCSITHTESMKRALESGARGLVMTEFTEDQLISGGIKADFNELKVICKKMADAFQKAKKVLFRCKRRDFSNLVVPISISDYFVLAKFSKVTT